MWFGVQGLGFRFGVWGAQSEKNFFESNPKKAPRHRRTRKKTRENSKKRVQRKIDAKIDLFFSGGEGEGFRSEGRFYALRIHFHGLRQKTLFSSMMRELPILEIS